MTEESEAIEERKKGKSVNSKYAVCVLKGIKNGER
jgi:hypothetical protein